MILAQDGICFMIGDTVTETPFDDRDLVNGFIKRRDKTNYNIRRFSAVDKYGIKEILVDYIECSTKKISSENLVDNIYNAKDLLYVKNSSGNSDTDAYAFFWGIDIENNSIKRYSFSTNIQTTETGSSALISLQDTDLAFTIQIKVDNREIC